MPFKNETIWIIGASSGIGRELSMQIAKSGAYLILSARRECELKKLQKELHGNHKIYPMDVSDKEQVKNTCDEISKLENGINRVIYMPAIYKPNFIIDMDLDFMSKMVDVNIKGAFYVTQGVLNIFKNQGYGQIALCASIAGYNGLPYGQPYSATKAAIINFTESLHAEAPKYIDVKLISPGFVSTPMTAVNKFHMPMIMTPQKAANEIINGLKNDAFEIHFPKKFTRLLKFLSLIPYWLKLKIIRKSLIKN